MSFFANDAINRVNAHSAVKTLAQAGGGIFFFAFLLQSGVPPHWALLAEAAVMAGRFALRPAVLPLAKRFGLKPLLIAGTFAMALPYPLLAEVDGVTGRLAVLVATRCVAEVLYWVAYNAYFAAVGDADGRARQISAREALVTTASIVAPLLGALGLTRFGAQATFAVVALVQAASALPLLGAPNVMVKTEASGVLRAARFTIWLNAADGWLDSWFFHVWQIVLFATLARSFEAYGGAMALAGLTGAAFGLLLGRHVDAGGGRRAVALAYGAMALVVVLQAASGGLPELALVANAASPVALALLSPALGAAMSNHVQASPCALRTTVANEGAWDLGCFAACLAGAAIAASGAPLAPAILLGLPGLALTAVLLRRYYAGVAARGTR
jgi:MFS transporter, DHA1 family, inner membrane transport protein